MVRAQPAYSDLEIRIGERQAEGYGVELTLDTGLQFPRGHLSPALLPWRAGKTLDEEGARLFAWFTSDPPVQKAWAAVRQANPFCRVRLRIDEKAPELQALPWELMAEQMAAQPRLHVAAADATPFSRYIAGVWQPGSAVIQRPLRMLAVVAAPPDLADVGLAPLYAAAELAVLRQAAGELELEITPFPPDPGSPCTLVALEAELRKGYHILHIVAHGTVDARSGEPYLVLADEANKAVPVRGTAIAELLARHMSGGAMRLDDRLRFVYLDACLGAATAGDGVGPPGGGAHLAEGAHPGARLRGRDWRRCWYRQASPPSWRCGRRCAPPPASCCAARSTRRCCSKAAWTWRRTPRVRRC